MPKMSNLQDGNQQKTTESPTDDHPLINFIHNLSARLPVPLTTPSLDNMKKQDFQLMYPLIGMTFSMNKTVRVLKAEVSAILFDHILIALQPLKSVPVQGTVAKPDKKKDRHIGQLRQAFKDGTNNLQSKIFNDLQQQSENPIAVLSTDYPHRKGCQDQEATAENESVMPDILNSKGSMPSVPEPPVGRREDVRPKASIDPMSTITPILS